MFSPTSPYLSISSLPSSYPTSPTTSLLKPFAPTTTLVHIRSTPNNNPNLNSYSYNYPLSRQPPLLSPNLRRCRLGQHFGSIPMAPAMPPTSSDIPLKWSRRSSTLSPHFQKLPLLTELHNECEVVSSKQIKWVGSLLLSFRTPN